MKKSNIVRFLLSVLALAGIVWLCIPFFWHVANPGNLVGIPLCFITLLACVFYPRIREKCKISKRLKMAWRVVCVLFCAGIVWSVFLTLLMFYGISSQPPQKATVLVLGSKVSGRVPSADLMARIDAAAAYLNENPQAKCIASGGQGPGELETEGSVIKKYLVLKGIDSGRIITEESSKNTVENFTYSLQIIDREGLSRELAIVTDEYHQYRAGQIAKQMGAVPYSACARTPWYIFSACYARELLALSKFLIFP